MTSRLLAELLEVEIGNGRIRLRERLEGMSDEEYLWEPVTDSWTVRRRETATSPAPQGRGEWVFDNAHELLSPGPFTTIAWRLMHLSDVLASYRIALWGGELDDDLVEVTPSAAEGTALFDRYAAEFLDALSAEDDDSLQQIEHIPWWPQEAPRWRVIANVATELVHHGAEIGVVRDLHARKEDLQEQPG